MTDQTFTTPSPFNKVKVWDIGVRLFHWGLVVATVLAYLTEDDRSLHRTLGYVVIGLIAFRLIWGMIGPRRARFASFIPGPFRAAAYLRDILRGTEARYLGHNPAGALMIVALLVTLAAVGATGYMMGMDAYFGQEWVEEAHEAVVNLLLVLVVLHIGGVVLASRRHKENLVLSMIHGHKERHDTDADP